MNWTWPPSKYQLVQYDAQGVVGSVQLDTAYIIPPDGRLMFVLPELINDADFDRICQEIRHQFETRRHAPLILRAGDMHVYVSEETEGVRDETHG